MLIKSTNWETPFLMTTKDLDDKGFPQHGYPGFSFFLHRTIFIQNSASP